MIRSSYLQFYTRSIQVTEQEKFVHSMKKREVCLQIFWFGSIKFEMGTYFSVNLFKIVHNQITIIYN